MKGTIIMGWGLINLKPWVQYVLIGLVCGLLALGASLLQGCSAPVEGFASQVESDLGERCGWTQVVGSPFAPQSECQVVYAPEGSGLGIWHEGDDPCTVPPLTRLRVEAGQTFAEWQRFGTQETAAWSACQ